MLKSLFMGSVAAVFAAGAAFADVDAWDVNEDDMIDADEYAAGMEDDETFDLWDEDDDEMLSRDEWQAGNWRQYDVDKDDMWNAEEAGAFRDMVTRVGAEVSQ